MNPIALNTYISGLSDIHDELSRQTINPAIWDVAESVMTLFEYVKPQDLSSLQYTLSLELSLSTWLSDLSEGELSHINGAVEVFAAQLESGDSIDEVSKDTITTIGEERVREGQMFVEWFEEQVSLFHLESGHLVLAKGLGRKCVYHAGRSGSKGMHELVWEKVARRWDWMSNHPGGFVVAGRELVALGRERVGRVLMQYGHLGEKGVALRLAAQGEGELEGDIRELLGIEPYGGGIFDDALELTYYGWFGDAQAIADAGNGKIVTTGIKAEVKLWDLESARTLRTLPRAVYDGVRQPHVRLAVVGKWAVTASDIGLEVWHLELGILVPNTATEPRTGIKGIVAVDDRTFVTDSKVGLGLWKLSDDGVMSKLRNLGEGNATAVGSAGATYVAIGLKTSSESEDLIVVYDSMSGDVVGKMRGCIGMVLDFGLLPDGRLITGTTDRRVRVWPANHNGTAQLKSNIGESGVNAVCALEDGRVVSGDQTGWVRLWSLQAGSSGLQVFDVLYTYSTCVYEIIPVTGNRFLTIASQGHPLLWRVSPLKDESPAKWTVSEARKLNPDLAVFSGAVLDDGRVVTGSLLKELVIWEAPVRGREAQVEKVVVNWITEDPGLWVEVVAPTCRGFAFAMWTHPEVYSYHVANDGMDLLEGCTSEVIGLTTIDEGSTVIAMEKTGLKAWSVETGESLGGLCDLERETWVCMSQLHANRIVVAGKSMTIGVLNVRSWILERTLAATCPPAATRPAFTSVVSVNATTVLACSHQGIWELSLKDGSCALSCSKVSSVHCSLGNRNVLVSARNLQVWNWQKRETVAELRGLEEEAPIGDIAWDSKRRLAVVFFQQERLPWLAYSL